MTTTDIAIPIPPPGLIRMVLPTDLSDWHDEDSNAFILWLKSDPKRPTAGIAVDSGECLQRSQRFPAPRIRLGSCWWTPAIAQACRTPAPISLFDRASSLTTYPLIGRGYCRVQTGLINGGLGEYTSSLKLPQRGVLMVQGTTSDLGKAPLLQDCAGCWPIEASGWRPLNHRIWR